MIQAAPALAGTVKLIPAVSAHPLTAKVPINFIPTACRILDELGLYSTKIEVGQHPNDHLFLSIEGPALHDSTLRSLRQRIWKELRIGIIYNPL